MTEEQNKQTEEVKTEESSATNAEETTTSTTAQPEEELQKGTAVIDETNVADKPKGKREMKKPNADFDWDRYEGGRDDYADSEREELEKLYQETIAEVRDKEVVQGKIVAITDRDVVLNIGYKSDGLLPLSEFKYLDEIKEGDTVEVLIENLEDKNGQIILSHRKALAEKAWTTILDAHENDKILRGYIKDRTKGGMIIEIMTMDAFLPGSQIDVKPIKDYDSYVGQHMDVKVVKINEAFRNIVVSHKAIIEGELEEQKTEILSKLEKGQVLEGIVKNLTNFGVFVDLGGVDGLIHITDVSWGRINHPEEVLELGEKLNVVVLDYDQEKKRISLGLKQLTPHPWETLPEDIKEGSKVTGKVVNIEDYGAFVEIYAGVEGLVHVSEMSWSNHLKSPNEYVKLNDEVECVVLSIDRDERKLALGMKQLTSDPWENIESRYPVGSTHKATIRGMMNFGMFVEMEEGVDGLVHISDLSWTKKFAHPAEYGRVGDEIEVSVLEIDKDNRRLSLGIKQLEEDPWDSFAETFEIGSVHEGTVLKVDDKGAVIQLPYGVEAFAPSKHLQKEDKTKVKAEETLPVRILEFDKDNRRILVSHTDLWKEMEREQRRAAAGEQRKEEGKTKKAISKLKSATGKTTMADELDILSQLKDKMETSEKKSAKKAKSDKDEAKAKAKEQAEDEAENAAEEAEEKPKKKKATKKAASKSSEKKEETAEAPKEKKAETSAKAEKAEAPKEEKPEVSEKKKAETPKEKTSEASKEDKADKPKEEKAEAKKETKAKAEKKADSEEGEDKA